MKRKTPLKFETAELVLPVSQRDHIQGSLNAPLQLLEYGDYECPFCGDAFRSVQAVRQRLKDRLCFAFRNFPLTEVHPHAEPAAEAAEAAGAQGRFWEMHDLLYENQDALEAEDLLEYASALGLEIPLFVKEIDNRVYLPRIREDFISGIRSGVNGTPTFFINGVRHDGGYDPDTLINALEEVAVARR